MGFCLLLLCMSQCFAFQADTTGCGSNSAVELSGSLAKEKQAVPSLDLRTVDGMLAQLKSELRKEGITDEFIRATEGSVKRILLFVSGISDIKTVLLDLWRENVKGMALKNAISAVAELVASGDNVLEAAKVASDAAHRAQAQGLSGFGVGMRVKKAVQDRKIFLKSTKG